MKLEYTSKLSKEQKRRQKNYEEVKKSEKDNGKTAHDNFLHCFALLVHDVVRRRLRNQLSFYIYFYYLYTNCLYTYKNDNN